LDEWVVTILARVQQPGGMVLHDAERSGDLEVDRVLADEGVVAGLVADVPLVQRNAVAIAPSEEVAGVIFSFALRSAITTGTCRAPMLSTSCV
jgi:hypothetical protein